MEILIQMAPFHYTLLGGRFQVTHIGKLEEEGFPRHPLHFKV